MFGLIRRRFYCAFAAVLLAATVAFLPAQAATITSGALASGIGIDLSGVARCGHAGALATNVGTFTASGGPGSGASVCGDASSVQVKDASSPNPFGRHNPEGGAWIDSNDNERVTWDVNIGIAFTGLSFALVDANDQRDSFFEMVVNGGAATWDIPDRDPNAEFYWLTVLFDTAVDSAIITFSTRRNDGFGIASATVAPIPVPAAGWLLVSGALAFVAIRRRPAIRI